MRQPKDLNEKRGKMDETGRNELTTWLDALTKRRNLGFIVTLVCPVMASERRVQIRWPRSAFQQWIRPSLDPRRRRGAIRTRTADPFSPEKTYCASGLNDASMGRLLLFVKPWRKHKQSSSLRSLGFNERSKWISIVRWMHRSNEWHCHW